MKEENNIDWSHLLSIANGLLATKKNETFFVYRYSHIRRLIDYQFVSQNRQKAQTDFDVPTALCVCFFYIENFQYFIMNQSSCPLSNIIQCKYETRIYLDHERMDESDNGIIDWHTYLNPHFMSFISYIYTHRNIMNVFVYGWQQIITIHDEYFSIFQKKVFPSFSRLSFPTS